MKVTFLIERTIDCLGHYPSNALTNLVGSYQSANIGDYNIIHYEDHAVSTIYKLIKSYKPDTIVCSGPCRSILGYNFFTKISCIFICWDYTIKPFLIPGVNISLDTMDQMMPMWTPQDERLFHLCEKDIDVCFVGTTDERRYPNRKPAIEHLRNNGIQVITLGGLEQGKWVAPKDYVSVLCRSKISLNFSRGIYGGWQIKGRSFESFFAKCLLLDDSPILNHYFEPNREFVQFGDLLSLVKYYLKNDKERETIASNGYTRVTTDYSSLCWWLKVLNVISLL